MKLALYLPNFRDKVTVKELEDLTSVAEELEELDGSTSVDDLQIGSMIWFVITDAETDQAPLGKAAATCWPEPRRRSPPKIMPKVEAM